MKFIYLFCLVVFLQVDLIAQKSFLALGDSYTIGESVQESERWPVQLAKELNDIGYQLEQPKIIARTGWRTDELKAAVNDANLLSDYDLVGLLIGVNNQYQGKTVESYQPEFEELLRKAIELAGGDKSKVFVVSIPDYGFTPFGESKKTKISKELDDYNSVNRSISKALGVQYFYITDISRSGKNGLVAKDNLHPSGEQYRLWVAEMLREKDFFKILD